MSRDVKGMDDAILHVDVHWGSQCPGPKQHLWYDWYDSQGTNLLSRQQSLQGRLRLARWQLAVNLIPWNSPSQNKDRNWPDSRNDAEWLQFWDLVHFGHDFLTAMKAMKVTTKKPSTVKLKEEADRFPGRSGTVSDPKVRYIARRRQGLAIGLLPPCYLSHFWVWNCAARSRETQQKKGNRKRAANWLRDWCRLSDVPGAQREPSNRCYIVDIVGPEQPKAQTMTNWYFCSEVDSEPSCTGSMASFVSRKLSLEAPLAARPAVQVLAVGEGIFCQSS